MSRVIVTGVSGFIGRHLVEGLKKTSYEIVEIHREHGDIADKSTWDKLPSAEAVIHLAARSSIVDSWDDVAGFMKANLIGTVEALNYCKKHSSRMIYISSYLYGNSGHVPVKESAELSVINPYAYTKKLAEETCHFYSRYFNVPVTVFRPFNVYGPGQSERFIVPVLVSQIKKGEAIRVKDLNMRRDYLYIEDFVRAIILALEHKDKFGIFNIGSGQSYSGAELIDIIQKYAGTNLPVFSEVKNAGDEIMDTIADISKAKKELLWEPNWALPDGIQDTLLKMGV
jgi:GDP-4-dehydro-6-deoxy-D-mannose reductase